MTRIVIDASDGVEILACTRRGPFPRGDTETLWSPDPGVALREGHQRPDRSHEQLIKKVKRVGRGFRNFANYRIRVLLHAGKPDWSLLASVAPL